jgi:hypothetical protein
MREAGHLDSHAGPGQPGSWRDFEALSDSEQKQVVRTLAVQAIDHLRESTPGVPWITSDMSWSEAALVHLEQTGGRKLDDYAPLREAGIPLVNDHKPASLGGGDDPDMMQAMHEAGVPLRGRTPSPRQLAPLAVLVDRGVPMREAVPPSMAMPDSRRADDRPHVEIVKDLDAAIGDDHPDRDHLPGLLAAGAALTSDQKHLIDSLAAKHSGALQGLRGDSATEPFGESGSIEAALREAGIRLKDA